MIATLLAFVTSHTSLHVEGLSTTMDCMRCKGAKSSQVEC